MKKNKLFIIALLSYSVIALSGCAKKEIKNIDSKGTNIICFGDSFTFGYGANPGEDYPAVLAKMMNIPVFNMGIDGDTSVEALRRLKTDVLQRDPLLVIIEFGGNDFLRKIPKEVTIKNIEEMVNKIQERGVMVAVMDISAGPILKEYRLAFSDLAQDKQAIFIPQIFSGIVTNPRLKSDFMHPNADGYKVIAWRIYRAIVPYLNQNQMVRRTPKKDIDK